MKHIIIFTLLLSFVSSFSFYKYEEDKAFQSLYQFEKQELLSEYRNNNSSKTVKSTGDSLNIKYDNFNLNVDFYSQSPFGKWGPIFNDTCEEASLLIALNYIRGIKMTKEEFRDELLKIVKWEKNNFGYFENTNVKETSEILSDYYNFNNFEIIDNPSIEDIKQNINKDSIVIAPLYGRYLNPNFLLGGPVYHFLVIKGYTNNDFITHDVGTKYGGNYRYNQKKLFDRIHDYNKISIKNGEKKIIVLKR